MLVDSGISDRDIDRWTQLGDLRNAVPLVNINVNVRIVEQFDLYPDLLPNICHTINSAFAAGMSADHLPWWYAAHIYRPKMVKHPINLPQWKHWRRVGTTQIGMRRAALAAAAGIPAKDAIKLIQENQWDDNTIETMAAIRRLNR